MKNKKGFTLTEILLAVMIVGIIGVALAALTTAASRESGVGRSKILLRNNLSIALRQLRDDIHASSRVMYVRGRIDSSSEGAVTPLLLLAKNINLNNNAINSMVTPSYVTYCFVTGGTTATPTGALSKGTIYRRESSSVPTWDGIAPVCGTPDTDDNFEVFLHNVKFIPPIGSSGDSKYYPVPLFRLSGSDAEYSEKDAVSVDWRRKDLASVLVLKIITELDSTPIVNDVVEETFILPNGFRVED
ncbi:PulJ/GspJ family protein [Candidatus Avelusimicrobium gallicola]|uniref:Uncharacterized protein n=1 Tax=Candidatus Avelusimicrobium gallicola TaxID=2562704 RepID=A0A1Y4DE89_9BACT|nr:type II secretion system protein [Elusimicrobium sp. An273]OUO56972.1 hypothetical protein B5F75_03755 [Elusimicrobium sp. An273]